MCNVGSCWNQNTKGPPFFVSPPVLWLDLLAATEGKKKPYCLCSIKDDFLKMCRQQNPCLSNCKNKKNLKTIINLFIHIKTENDFLPYGVEHSLKFFSLQASWQRGPYSGSRQKQNHRGRFYKCMRWTHLGEACPF